MSWVPAECLERPTVVLQRGKWLLEGSPAELESLAFHKTHYCPEVHEDPWFHSPVSQLEGRPARGVGPAVGPHLEAKILLDPGGHMQGHQKPVKAAKGVLRGNMVSRSVRV